MKALEVRLIDANGNNIGVISKKVALEKAQESGLDLVEVAPEAKPPVCKIMDYSRYHYERKKKERDNKRKAKTTHLKQIRLSPNINKHDLAIKFKKIKVFLEEGHKVRINMLFKGRQQLHKEIGTGIMDAIIGQLEGVATCQEAPKYEGRFMSVTMVPGNTKMVENV